MNFKLKLGLVSLSYLCQFNSKFNIQDEFWNLDTYPSTDPPSNWLSIENLTQDCDIIELAAL